MADIEHGKLVALRPTTNAVPTPDPLGRGIHGLKGFVSVVDASALSTLQAQLIANIDTTDDVRVVEQTGGTVPGLYVWHAISQTFWFLGGTASNPQTGVLTMVYMGGAAAPSAGEHLEVNVGVGGASAALGVSTESVCGKAGAATVLTWNSATASTDTVLKVIVAGSSVASVTLTGASGSIAVPSTPAVTAGQKLAIEYDAGTAPGNITVQLYVQ